MRRAHDTLQGNEAIPSAPFFGILVRVLQMKDIRPRLCAAFAAFAAAVGAGEGDASGAGEACGVSAGALRPGRYSSSGSAKASSTSAMRQSLQA